MSNLAGVLALIAISSATDCPSAEAVQERLAPLMSGRTSSDSVRIEQTEDALLVTMRSALHHSVFRRLLPRRQSCEENAALVATVIAAWQLEEQQSPAEPLPATASVNMSVDVNASPAPGLTPPPVASRPRAPSRYELAGALVGGAARDGFTPGAQLDILMLPSDRPLALRLGIFGQTPRSLALGPGQASWLRAGLRLSAGYRLLPPGYARWTIDCFADAAVAMVVSGVDTDADRTRAGADLGLGGSVRIGRQLGPARLFFEVALAGWFLPQKVVRAHSDQPVSASLPPCEGWFSVGAAGPVGAAQRRRKDS